MVYMYPKMAPINNTPHPAKKKKTSPHTATWMKKVMVVEMQCKNVKKNCFVPKAQIGQSLRV